MADQDDVIAFLSSAEGHPGGAPVEVVQTHGAQVFLAGDVALKIKRAVRYDYMDLSTLGQREAMLRRELDLNRPHAPEIYRDVVPVTRAPDGELALDGQGVPVEWVLRMWRFPAEAELSRIASAGGIDDALADALGRSIHAFHTQAPHATGDGAQFMRDILDELERVFTELRTRIDPALTDTFLRQGRTALNEIAPSLRQRGQSGHLRRCHGDLHLGNIVRLDGRPVLFDALEFDETLATCDVLYDLAFLIMDLCHRGLERPANMVLNAYLLSASSSEDEGLIAMPLFLAVRAAIRAMVTAQKAKTGDADLVAGAGQYLQDALGFLSPAPPRLVLVGGLSGTGKTTLARALAPQVGAAPGAIHLRSDLERKAMRGEAPETRLAEADYTSDARGAVYARMFDRGAAILAARHSVVFDATFLDGPTRQQAEALGVKAGVKTLKLWLEAPLPDLIARVDARTGDASDADREVVLRQVKEGVAPSDWQVISAAGRFEETLERAREICEAD